MGKSARRKDDGAETGVDIVQPFMQAHVVATNSLSESKFAPGTVGELRDRLEQHCIKTGKRYDLHPPHTIPPVFLEKSLDELEKGEMWFLGKFGDVRAYAEKGQGFFSTESESKSVIEDLCKFVTRDVKEPKVLTLHFATRKSDALVAAWCKANNVQLKRMYADPNPPAPESTPASVTLPKP